MAKRVQQCAGPISVELVLHRALFLRTGIDRLPKGAVHVTDVDVKADWRASERQRREMAAFGPFVGKHVGENVEEILRADLELELEALTQLRGAIAHCEKVHDYVSRDLFSEILENEEEHVDTLEQQFEMIQRMGLQNYIQLQSEAAGDTRSCRTPGS